jgi:tRNA-splicing ligase RtcB
MRAVKTSLTEIDEETLKKITGEIRKVIPVGFRHHTQEQSWSGFAEAPKIETIQNELRNAMFQIGTLGGGNHFVEIQRGDDGHIWIMVHSGSRNFGFKTAGYYNRKAVEYCKENHLELPSKDLAYLPFESEIGQEYFGAMNYCQNFARGNRELMMESTVRVFEDVTSCGFEPAIDIHHNFASVEEHFGEKVIVHRKGATQAFKGMRGIIPGSMGTPSYITEGLGNEESFSSCAHGAGRILGRQEAIRTLDLEEEQRKMEGILGGPRGRRELQEAPGAYKNIDEVMQNQRDLVKILVKLSPLSVIIGT